MILQGDCLAVMASLEAESFDSIVTDPPYHLTTGKKGGTGEASVNLESPYGRARIGTGFMGMTWDGGDVALRPETWAAALRVAKPGAYLVAFGGTRTFHRMMCAIEDAGWELRDTLMWVYGSGFPKSKKIGGGLGTALKPAWELIVLARKPLKGTVAANVARFGTGALNIDGCRIEATDKTPAPVGEFAGSAVGPVGLRGIRDGIADDLGRWPANVLHDGSDEVIAAFPNAPGQQGDLTGDEPSQPFKNAYGVMAGRLFARARIDTGSAARFFYCAKASRADRDAGLEDGPKRRFGMSGGAAAAAARGEHYDIGDGGVNRTRLVGNFHPTVKPTDLMRWLCRLVTPAGGHVLDPFTGSGSTGRAAMMEGMRFTGIELDPEYVAIAEARIRAAQSGLAF